MTITFHPRLGQLLMCNFESGFRKPEMTKVRPVIVISPKRKSGANLVTVVALSTVEPAPIMRFHAILPNEHLPMLNNFQRGTSWIKGDMIYSVGFHRLNLIQLGNRNTLTGKRMYFKKHLGRGIMKTVHECVLAGLNLQRLAKHL